MAQRKHTIVWALAGVVIVGAVFVAVRAYRNFATVPGVYLTEGGIGCIVITSRLPGWEVEKQFVAQSIEYRIVPAGSQLRLEGRASPDFARRMGRESEWDYVWLLARSPSRRGDWDLVGWYGDGWRSSATRATTSSRPVSPTPYLLTRRLPYLHRLSDQRVVEYFELQYSDKSPVPAYEKARGLLTSYPDDLHVRALYLCAATYSDDTSEVARRLDEWKSDFEQAGDPYLSRTTWRTKMWLRAQRLTAAGRNAYDFCKNVFGRESDLTTRLRLFPQIFQYEAFVVPLLPQRYFTVPNLLELQVSAKVHRVIATFQMIEGKREESLQLLAATCHLGQTLMDGSSVVQRLIGLAVRSIACGGLEIYALNCCESDTEFRQLWAMLERLEETQKPSDLKELYEGEQPIYRYLPEGAWPSSLEAEMRGNFGDSRFELLRAATAAKYRLVSQGEFPKSNDQFGPLLPQGPPKDPFADGPMRFRATTDALFCYSIGPDKHDDRATIEYDPTNGTISAGDIWTKIPRQRQYPFPRGGVRAASEDDLWRQFPNGLPVDPFASTKGKSLGSTTSLTGDLFVYSYGPDVDQFKDFYPGPEEDAYRNEFYKTPSSLLKRSFLPGYGPIRSTYGEILLQRLSFHILEAPYDPTNGVVSEGDLFIRIPRR